MTEGEVGKVGSLPQLIDLSRASRALFLTIAKVPWDSPLSLNPYWNYANTEDINVQIVYINVTHSCFFLAVSHSMLFSLFKCRELYNHVGKKYIHITHSLLTYFSMQKREILKGRDGEEGGRKECGREKGMGSGGRKRENEWINEYESLWWQGTQTKTGLWDPLMEDVFAAGQEPNRRLKEALSSSEIFWLIFTYYCFTVIPFLWLKNLIVTSSFFILKVTTVRYSAHSLMFRQHFWI